MVARPAEKQLRCQSAFKAPTRGSVNVAHMAALPKKRQVGAEQTFPYMAHLNISYRMELGWGDVLQQRKTGHPSSVRKMLHKWQFAVGPLKNFSQ